VVGEAGMADDPRPVAVIFRSAAFSRSEQFIQAQAAALKRYRPLVLAFKRTGDLAPELEGRVLAPFSGGEALALRLGRLGRLPPGLAEARPALIHAHFAPDGLIALPIARALGAPLLTTLRGYDVTVYPARMLGSGRLSWMRYAMAGERLRREGELFLAVSEALRRQAVARGFPAERTLLHYDGVDVDRFRPAPGAAVPGLVVHVGRLVEKKGTALLLRAFAEARGARPESQLVIIGEGPLRHELEKLSGALGLGQSVRFLGALPHAAVRDWMQRAWVLAAPSITGRNGDQEGLPTVLVEAAACGAPLIGSLHSGIPEIVVDGESGRLVPEGAVGALARRLEEVAASPELRNRLARGARALVERRFDGARQGEALEAIYDRLRTAA
jgi:glycosyltransferase involved in cell wall biosynthesis